MIAENSKISHMNVNLFSIILNETEHRNHIYQVTFLKKIENKFIYKPFKPGSLKT